MITPTGFVTEAYLPLDMHNHWISYYKWLRKGKWSWLALAKQFTRLVLKITNSEEIVHLVIDDTSIFQYSNESKETGVYPARGAAS